MDWITTGGYKPPRIGDREVKVIDRGHSLKINGFKGSLKVDFRLKNV